MMKRARFSSSIVGIQQIVTTEKKRKIRINKLFRYMEGETQINIKEFRVITSRSGNLECQWVRLTTVIFLMNFEKSLLINLYKYIYFTNRN